MSKGSAEGRSSSHVGCIYTCIEFSGAAIVQEISKRKPYKTLSLYQNLSAFLKNSNVSQFCCQKQPFPSQKRISSELPLKNRKTWPTLIRGQCYITRPETIFSDQLQIALYLYHVNYEETFDRRQIV